MEKDHKIFHQTTFVKINQFIKMKKIAYCLLIGLSFTLLCSCFSDKDKVYYMDEVNMDIILCKKSGNNSSIIFFCDSGKIDSSNYIKFSTKGDLPPMRIILNRTDSIIYLYRVYSQIDEINISDFKVVKINNYEDYNLYKDNQRGLFWDNDSIVFSNLNQEKKEIAVFEIWSYSETINKWYTTPSWHKMESYYSY
ncbi:MAG: hypothetical protein IKJ52_04595 [Muribaculaceae bacterium]|nr:hypothetical protein [Muribaculaceae bacterium]